MEQINKITASIENVQSFLGNISIFILFTIFIYMFISDFIGICRLSKMVLDIYRSQNKDLIISHIRFLLKTKGEFLEKVVNFEYIHTWNFKQVDEIIKRNTIKTQKECEYGVFQQQKALYYTDLQKACIESKKDLDTLAFALALFIVNEIDIYNSRNSYVLVGQSDGNVILANRVASILGLKFLIVGNLAGKKENIFGNFSTSDKIILVDDILFTGTMLVKNLEVLHKNNLICTHIVVVMRRSLAYQEHLSKYTNNIGSDVEVKSIVTYLDTDFNDKYM